MCSAHTCTAVTFSCTTSASVVAGWSRHHGGVPPSPTHKTLHSSLPVQLLLKGVKFDHNRIPEGKKKLKKKSWTEDPLIILQTFKLMICKKGTRQTQRSKNLKRETRSPFVTVVRTADTLFQSEVSRAACRNENRLNPTAVPLPPLSQVTGAG